MVDYDIYGFDLVFYIGIVGFIRYTLDSMMYGLFKYCPSQFKTALEIPPTPVIHNCL